MQAVARLRNEAVTPAAPRAPRLDAEIDDRWPRRSRFIFIAGAAAISWLVPGFAVYLLMAPH